MTVNLFIAGAPTVNYTMDLTETGLRAILEAYNVLVVGSGGGRMMSADRLRLNDNMTVDLYAKAGLEERVSVSQTILHANVETWLSAPAMATHLPSAFPLCMCCLHMLLREATCPCTLVVPRVQAASR